MDRTTSKLSDRNGSDAVDAICDLLLAENLGVAPGLVVGGAADDATVRAMAAGQTIALARLQGSDLSPVRVFNL